jgi:hypothetical protein
MVEVGMWVQPFIAGRAHGLSPQALRTPHRLDISTARSTADAAPSQLASSPLAQQSGCKNVPILFPLFKLPLSPSSPGWIALGSFSSLLIIPDVLRLIELLEVSSEVVEISVSKATAIAAVMLFLLISRPRRLTVVSLRSACLSTRPCLSRLGPLCHVVEGLAG